MDKIKFPIPKRSCNELLSGIYQRFENFEKLTSGHYLQKDFYIKPNPGKEWHSGRINYDELGNIIHEETFNQAGELIDKSNYEFAENSVICTSNDRKSSWKFNEYKLLIEEIHEYGYDQPDIYSFSFNGNNQLENINNEFHLEWVNNEPLKLVRISDSKALRTILYKTSTESKVLNHESNEITTYKYSKYGRLLEVKTGNTVTSFNYFGYDMMHGFEAKTKIGNKITYKTYNEERLLTGKMVESITNLFENGMNLSSTVREVKQMK